jgi:multidrug efflux pump subunit AcrA (membrane-fusion protein)
MRRALGLEGEQPRPAVAPPAPERVPQFNRPKRRFVTDGEIPVVHGRLQRRDEAGGPQATPVPSRLEAAETAARFERDAREKAERALAEAQAAVHDLETRLGHAQLAATETHNALEAERAATEALRMSLREAEQQAATALAEKEAAEQMLRAAQATATTLRRGRPVADAPTPASTPRRGRPRKIAKASPPARPVGAAKKRASAGASTPKPVRWWLKPKSNKPKRR